MKENSQNQKVALITGAARRIGAAIARQLHAAGMNIVLHYHTSKKEATSLCAQLNRKRPQSAVTLQANLADIASLEPLIKQAALCWHRLDALINNASQFYQTPIKGTNDE